VAATQEPVLFHTSISENIRYGKPGASDDEVQEAARRANAHDFIKYVPLGSVHERTFWARRFACIPSWVYVPSVLCVDVKTFSKPALPHDSRARGLSSRIFVHALWYILKKHAATSPMATILLWASAA
jgi:hypothetical protein